MGPDPALKVKGWRQGDEALIEAVLLSGPCPESEGMETVYIVSLSSHQGPDPALKVKGWRRPTLLVKRFLAVRTLP